jgi:hypothetical protein
MWLLSHIPFIYLFLLSTVNHLHVLPEAGHEPIQKGPTTW